MGYWKSKNSNDSLDINHKIFQRKRTHHVTMDGLNLAINAFGKQKHPLIKRYPAQLSLTSWMCFMGAAQSAIFTVIVEQNNPSAWIIGLNIDLWSIIYWELFECGSALVLRTGVLRGVRWGRQRIMRYVIDVIEKEINIKYDIE
ncbi:transmembrane protein, putative [Medicago truncatula]|uniref:Transmembrane protein, putative n=1 Tax=Medicago truncatula TaxID=3880 RepID=A0A072VM51_MEDTR|nr:transmembrane protein, putative [Medicago truncatula]